MLSRASQDAPTLRGPACSQRERSRRTGQSWGQRVCGRAKTYFRCLRSSLGCKALRRSPRRRSTGTGRAACRRSPSRRSKSMATMVQSLSLRWRRRYNSCWPRATINRFSASGSTDDTFTLLLGLTISPPPHGTRTTVREERQGGHNAGSNAIRAPRRSPTRVRRNASRDSVPWRGTEPPTGWTGRRGHRFGHCDGACRIHGRTEVF